MSVSMIVYRTIYQKSLFWNTESEKQKYFPVEKYQNINKIP